MNIDLIDIKKEILSSSKRIKKGTGEIFSLAEEKAKTEMEYRKALAIEKIALKDKGMAIGMIDDVAKGNLSELLFERDLAEARYVAARDSLRAIQSQLSALQSILRTQEEI